MTTRRQLQVTAFLAAAGPRRLHRPAAHRGHQLLDAPRRRQAARQQSGADQPERRRDRGQCRHIDCLVTDIGGDWQNGENTWGAPPTYWDTEKACFTTGVCP